jgi:hypothetical protein
MACSLLSFLAFFFFENCGTVGSGCLVQPAFAFFAVFFAFITVSLYGDVLRLYETFAKFSLHSGRDGSVLA